MPLNYETGEMVGGFGPHYHVVPTRKWVDTPFWSAAVEQAYKVFEKTVRRERMAQGRPLYLLRAFTPDNVLTQEYRRDAAIVFLFCAQVGTKEMFATVPVIFPPDAENQLVLTGRWKRESLQ
jgi:hypothetical protein